MTTYRITVAGRVLRAVHTRTAPAEADVELLRSWVPLEERWRDPDELACVVIQGDALSRRGLPMVKARSA